MKTPKLKCRHCNGKGKVGLDPVLAGTLHILQSLKKSTAVQMFNHLESQQDLCITSTAINKRLERLRAVGLVKRERIGKEWRYQPV